MNHSLSYVFRVFLYWPYQEMTAEKYDIIFGIFTLDFLQYDACLLKTLLHVRHTPMTSVGGKTKLPLFLSIIKECMEL